LTKFDRKSFTDHQLAQSQVKWLIAATDILFLLCCTLPSVDWWT